MQLKFQLLLLLWLITVTTYAQNNSPSLLNVGDSAPPLRVREWIKGKPIERFERGNVYVVEFWATWCKPCIAAMPHLSALAVKYKDKVTILGVNIYEKKTTSREKVKSFVDSMGHRMNYRVAAEDSNAMVAAWFKDFGEQGIPKSFVVDAQRRVAWIGHPKDLDEVLAKIVNNTWDIKKALANRNLNKRLAALDDSINDELMRYKGDPYKPGDLGKPDSALLMINGFIKKEPMLKYAPFIAHHTFSSLIKTNPHKAYEYGKGAIVTSTYEEPAYDRIIGAIMWYSDKLNLPSEIYQLGAEACQTDIDQIPYPELVDISKRYVKMADWYWLAKNKIKAIESQQKAIDALKGRKDYSKAVLAAFESRLREYKNK